MVVLATGREIGVDDIPKAIREGGGDRLLPVHIGPILREESRAEGRELEFIVRSLVELKLQVEELRRRVDEGAAQAAGFGLGSGGAHGLGLAAGAGLGAAGWPGAVGAGGAGGIEPPSSTPSSGITIAPGMTMAEIERAAIVAALRETRGTRRKAAENLEIGERTLYRKLKEYQIPEQPGD
jgi:DNA-binding NtrC family response regulator